MRVQDEPPGAAVPVEEGLHALELVMQPGQLLDEAGGQDLLPRESCRRQRGRFDRVLYLGWHQWPRWRCHPAAEGADVVLAEAARPFATGRVRVRGHIPDRGHRRVVDLADLSDCEEPAVVPVAWLQCLPVNPLSRVGVSAYLVVFAERLAPIARPWSSSAWTCRKTRVLPSRAVEW